MRLAGYDPRMDCLTITNARDGHVLTRPLTRDKAHDHDIDLQSWGFRVNVEQGGCRLVYHGDETVAYDGYVPLESATYSPAPAQLIG